MRFLPTTSAALALACSGGSSTAETADCASFSNPLERDVCYGKELKGLPASQADRALQIAGLMTDPMVRGEAVTTYVAAKANCLAPDKGQALCNVLEGRDQSYCQRRLSAPHLQTDCSE
jgi:hypothetical protein